MEEGIDLEGRIIGIAGVDDPENYNLVEYRKDEEGKDQMVGGYCAHIIWDLQFLLKFSIKQVLSNAYIKEENGTLVGTGGLLMSNAADVALPLSYLVPYRLKYLTALHPPVREPLLAVFKQPASTAVRDIYLATFPADLWAILVGYWALFYLLSKIHVTLSYAEESYESFLLVVAATSEQGWYRVPKSTHMKTLLLIFFGFGYLTMECYKALIIAELASERKVVTVFEDLWLYRFRILTDPVVQWGRYIAPPNRDRDQYVAEIASYFKSYEDSVSKSSEGNHAMLTTWDFFIPLARTLGYRDVDMCDTLDAVSVGKLATYSGFYVKKGSKVKEAFNYGMLRILQHGLHNRHYGNLLQTSTLKCFSKTEFDQTALSFTALQFRDTSSAFGLLIAGFMSGFLTLCSEVLWSSSLIMRHGWWTKVRTLNGKDG